MQDRPSGLPAAPEKVNICIRPKNISQKMLKTLGVYKLITVPLSNQ